MYQPGIHPSRSSIMTTTPPSHQCPKYLQFRLHLELSLEAGRGCWEWTYYNRITRKGNNSHGCSNTLLYTPISSPYAKIPYNSNLQPINSYFEYLLANCFVQVVIMLWLRKAGLICELTLVSFTSQISYHSPIPNTLRKQTQNTSIFHGNYVQG